MVSTYAVIALALTLLAITALGFYFLGEKRGFAKGHWLGQKQALRWILPNHLREIIGTDEKVRFPDYIKHGKLTLKTPRPDDFFPGKNSLHKLPIYADAIFSPDD